MGGSTDRPTGTDVPRLGVRDLVVSGRLTPEAGATLLELRRRLEWRRRPWWERVFCSMVARYDHE